MTDCVHLFLDCQGPWDFGGQIANAVITGIVAVRSFHNCWRLHRSRNTQANIEEQKLQQSRVRKLRINIMCSIFLIFLMGEIIFSFSSYIVFFMNESDGSIHTASIIYKSIQILVINFLNCLIVTVGELYWKALGIYQTRKGQNGSIQPTQQIQSKISKLLNKYSKYLFKVVYISSGCVVIASAVLLSLTHGEDDQEDYTIENIINFIITTVSSIIFVCTRYVCFQAMRRNSQILKKQLKKQLIITVSVILTCSLRVIYYWLAILDISPIEGLRSYEKCIDTMPWHSLYIIFLTIFVNLLPPFIFTEIYTPQKSDRMSKHLTETLTEQNYYSQISN